MPRRVAGADVWDTRWVVVTLVDGEFASVEVVDELRDFLVRDGQITCVGVDMPIELLPNGSPRPCDKEARAMVGKRSSSVFSAPPQSLLNVGDFAETNEAATTLGEARLSLQSYALREKIIEVRGLRDEFPYLHEVHPEVSFMVANDECPLEWSKHSWNGIEERRDILRRQRLLWSGPDAGAAGAGVDDVLDATIAAWSADRIARGASRRLPETGESAGVIEY
ncbi:MAG TPA: DUF429 domain-containing protein [Acidimicrobiales bacterium]|nr:DUF429 domain-containing protein [Acidimicrobiales bacterium]